MIITRFKARLHWPAPPHLLLAKSKSTGDRQTEKCCTAAKQRVRKVETMMLGKVNHYLFLRTALAHTTILKVAHFVSLENIL